MQGQFKEIGLKPGNPDGTYLQSVPLAGITSKSQPDIEVKGRKLSLANKKDYIALSSRYVPEVNVTKSDIVFVGYGVVAPEYGWDDYKDVDVRGKTILMLVNDPAVPDPNDPSKLDDKMFKGAAMTYYGRWTYKYEIRVGERRCRGPHYSRDGSGGISVRSGRRQLGWRELRHSAPG